MFREITKIAFFLIVSGILGEFVIPALSVKTFILLLFMVLMMVHSAIQSDISDSKYSLSETIHEINCRLSEIEDSLSQLALEEKERSDSLSRELASLESGVDELNYKTSNMNDELSCYLDRVENR